MSSEIFIFYAKPAKNSSHFLGRCFNLNLGQAQTAKLSCLSVPVKLNETLHVIIITASIGSMAVRADSNFRHGAPFQNRM